MTDRFPHIADTSFPGMGNPYQYQNTYDYTKYADAQMHIKLLSVPWDLGEVHVGLRSVPMGNVVAFETDQERDEWLDAQPGREFDTHYRAYHEGGEIKLPVPYEEVLLYNYVVIDYEQLPGADSATSRISRWLFFIREARMESVNSTVCTIARDSWSMFANSVDVSYMLLERGHGPMFAAPTPEDYLEAPIDNNENLLAPDVNYGEATQATEASSLVLNDGEMLACIVMTSNLTGEWGKKSSSTWKVAASTGTTQGGNLAPKVIAIDAADISGFLNTINSSYPQMLQTIQGVFFVSSKLVKKSSSDTFEGYHYWTLENSGASFELPLPTVSDFGYGDDVKAVTKLYTAPYAHIEITDENGDVTAVKIEDCSGTLRVDTALSLAYPWLNVSAHIHGIGGSSKKSVTFANVTEHTFEHSGRWYDTLRKWDIPVMAIYQPNKDTNDYATHYDREAQHATAYKSADTAYQVADNDATASVTTTKRSNEATIETADNSATTAKGNADRSADAGVTTTKRSNTATTNIADKNASVTKSNATNSAGAITTNATTQTTTATSVLKENQKCSISDTWLGNQLNIALAKYNRAFNSTATNVNIDSAVQSTAVSAIASGVSAIAGGAAIGGAAGAGVGLAGAAIGGVASGLNTMITTNASSTLTSLTNTNITNTLNETNQNNTDRTKQKAYGTDSSGDVGTASNDGGENKINRLNNEATKAIAQKNASVTTTNATNSAGATTYAASENTGAALDNANTNADTAKQNATDSAALTRANAKVSTSAALDNANTNAANVRANAKLNKATTKTNTDTQIAAQQATAAIKAPNQYGSYSAGETSTTRPQGLFLNVVTQSKSAIKQAATQFLRYGYAYNGMWEFEGFNIGKRFTYWKASDLWLIAPNLPDAFVDEIRNYLLQGVTVWRKPEYINNTTIYDNF